MKKVLWALGVLLIFVLSTTPTFASTFTEAEKSEGMTIINQANAEIENEINQAVAQAEQLTADYINKIRGKEAVEISALEREIQKASEQLANLAVGSQEPTELEQKVSELQAQVAQIKEKTKKHILEAQPAIDAFVSEFVYATDWTDEQLLEASVKLQSSLTGKFQIVKETQKYMKTLNQVIDDCYNVTLNLSLTAISQAAEKGVIAECSWVLIQFGYKSEWIDPIKIVGEL